MEELTNSDYFHGNLDKLGTTVSFLGYLSKAGDIKLPNVYINASKSK